MDEDNLDAGSVPASSDEFVVTYAHRHKTLKRGDRVVMTETPCMDNLLLRASDMTLHRLTDENGQYVHLQHAAR